jgi:hypothetical protein
MTMRIVERYEADGRRIECGFVDAPPRLTLVEQITTNRRAVLSAVLAAAALATVPSRGTAASSGVEPELQALLAVWRDANRRLEEAYEASCAASDRADCPVPQALFATESDASQWRYAVPGSLYDERDVANLRRWLPLSRFLPKGPDELKMIPGTDFDARANEIVASWDRWQVEQVAAKVREGVAAAEALHSQTVHDYHAIGRQVAKLRAKTMAGVIAKLLAAAPSVTPDQLDGDAHTSILAGAALDAQALANAPIGEVA